MGVFWFFSCLRGLSSFCFLHNRDKHCRKAWVKLKTKDDQCYTSTAQKHLPHTSGLLFHHVKLNTGAKGRSDVDLPKDCRQAWMSSSQLAPLVRCPRGMVDLPWVVWAGLGLWNLWGRPGGETLDLELHPGVALLEEKNTKHINRGVRGKRASVDRKCVFFLLSLPLSPSICIWGCRVCGCTNHNLMTPSQIITHETSCVIAANTGAIVWTSETPPRFCYSLFSFPSFDLGKYRLIADIHF